jgi:hypothetical protein
LRQDERDRLHWDEFEQTWSKRRRLAREKNELEQPRMVRPIPRTPGNRSTRWQVGATPTRLGMEEAAQDLAAMEVSMGDLITGVIMLIVGSDGL